jgi:hypothetical protein
MVKGFQLRQTFQDVRSLLVGQGPAMAIIRPELFQDFAGEGHEPVFPFNMWCIPQFNPGG